MSTSEVYSKILKMVNQQQYKDALQLFTSSDSMDVQPNESKLFLSNLYFLNQQFTHCIDCLYPVLDDFNGSQQSEAIHLMTKSFIQLISKDFNISKNHTRKFINFFKQYAHKSKEKGQLNICFSKLIFNISLDLPTFRPYILNNLNLAFFIHGKCASSFVRQWHHDYLASIEPEFNTFFKKFNSNIHMLGNPIEDMKNTCCMYSHPLYLNYHKLTFVRNPWDRIVSFYLDKFIRSKITIYPFWPQFNLHIANHNDSWNEKPLFTFRQLVNTLYDGKKNISSNLKLLYEPHLFPQAYAFENISFDEIYDFKEATPIFEHLNQILNFEPPDFSKKNVTKKSNQSTTLVCDYYPCDFNKNDIPTYHYFYDDDLIEKVAFIYHEDIQTYGFTFDSGYTTNNTCML